MQVEMSANRQSMVSAKEPGVPAGCVYWITGLSGAGKTTLGRELWQRLRAAGRSAIFLDGDMLREVIAEDLGHNLANRRKSAMRNARLCRMLASQGGDVVCPTISMFHDVQRWNRENIPNYREIYLRVPMDELQRRDAKGIYAAAKRGELCDVVGLDVAAELPEAPDLILDNFGALDSAAAVERIWTECVGPAHALRKTPAGPVRFATKAETLETLAPRLRTARVLPQIRFTVGEWRGSCACARLDPGRALEHDARDRALELAERGWRGQFAGGEIRFGARRARRGTADSGDRGSHRLVWRGRQLARPDFRAAHARARRGGGCRLLAPAERRWPLLCGELRRSLRPHRRGHRRHRRQSRDLPLPSLAHRRLSCRACPGDCAHGRSRELFGCDAIDVEFAIDGDGQLYLLQVRQLSVERQGMVADVEVSDALADVAPRSSS